MSTYAEILDLIASSSSSTIDLQDNRATLTLAQAQSLVAQGIVFASGDTIRVLDDAATIETLTPADIVDLKNLGVGNVLAGDRALVLGTAQVSAFAAQNVSVGSQYQTRSGATASDTVVGTFLYSAGGQSFVEPADGTFMVIYKQVNAAGFNALFAQHYDAKGEKIGGETAIATGDATHRAQASVALLDDGGYVVVWQTTDVGSETETLSLEFQRFDAGGNPVGDRIAMADATMAYMPKITPLSGGDFLVSWIKGDTMSLVAQRVDGATGQVETSLTFGQYLTVAGLISSEEATAYEIVPLSGGGFVVAWAANPQTGTGYDVVAQTLDAAGMPTAPAFVVNTTTAGVQVKPVVTALSDGRFAIAWQSNNSGSGWDVMVRIYNADGSFVSSETVASTYTASAQQDPSITTLEGGGFVVTWVSNDQDGSGLGVYGQVFDADGAKVGEEIHVSTTTIGAQDRSQVKALAGGGFVVAWLDLSEGDTARLKAQVFGAHGAAIGSEMAVNTDVVAGINAFKLVALSTGGFAVSWYMGGDTLTFRLFQNDTDPATLSGTAATISSLIETDIAELSELGIDKIVVSDGGNVTLSKAMTMALLGVAGLEITGAASVVVSATGAALDDFSPADIASLETLGVTRLDASDNAATLSFEQALAYVDAGIAFASGDAITMKLNMMQLVTMSNSTMDALLLLGLKVLDLEENAISLDIVGLGMLKSYGLSFAPSDVLTLVISQSDMSALTAIQISELASQGVTRIDIFDAGSAPTTLSLAQAKAIAATGIGFAQDNGTWVFDTAAALATLDAAGIAVLAGAGVHLVIAEQSLPVSASQFSAYADHDIVVHALQGAVSVRDTGARLATLDVSRIAKLSDFGITALDATDNNVVLSFAVLEAYRQANASFSAEDRVLLSVTSASVRALGAVDLVNAAGFGVSALTTSAATLDLAATTAMRIKASGLSLDTGIAARLSDTAANLLALSTTDVAGLSDIGIDVIRLADTGSAVAALSLASITALDGRGVSQVDLTDGTITLSLAQANKFAEYQIPFDSADTVIVTASSTTLSDPDTLDLAGLKAINIDRIDASDNKLALSLTAARNFVDAGIGFAPDDAVSVTITYAEAKTLAKATGSALHAAGVDRIEIGMTAQELKALTYAELKSFVAAGVDGIVGVSVLTFSNLTYDLATHTINYNPVITSNGGGSSAEISIAENTTAVTTVKAADQNPGSTLSFSIAGGADKALFSINAKTGTLSFKSAPDHENPADNGRDNAYDVVVQVSDGKLTGTQSIRVKVTDVNEAPTSPALSGTSVKENVAVGTTVGTLSAKDPEGRTLTYTLTDDAGGLFKLSGNKLVTARAIDYEAVKSGKVTVEVSDGVNKVAKTFTIGVQDVNEAPTSLALSGTSVKENVAVGTTVGTLSAKDPEGRTLTYTLTDNAGGLFKLSGNRLVTAKAIDYEAVKSGKVTVEVSDGVNKVAKTFTIGVQDVNEVDKAPTSLSLSAASVKENVKTGTTVGTFSAVDPEGKAISYTLTDDAGGLFKLSGAKLVTARAIDYEKVQKDTVTVAASDGVNTVAKTFTIKIADVVETIAGTSKAETLKGGIGADLIKGNGGNDKLHGYAGNDQLKGGAGDDILIGGAGADRLDGGAGNDTASYQGAGKGVTASLAKPSANSNDARGDVYVSIENLTGTSHADRLTGDGKANVLSGGAGKDVLKGGAGDDTLVGGKGADDLHGGKGADTFVFKSLSELAASKTKTDTIFDFSQKEKDLIDLTGIDAMTTKSGNQAFAFVGTEKFSKTAGELRYAKEKADTYVYGDVNGDGKADFVIHIDSLVDFKADDFLL